MHEQTPAPNIPAPDSSPSPRADVSPAPVDFDLDGDARREECRALGVFGHHETRVITALGPHALRRRGQEAAATVHSRDATILRDLPLVPRLEAGERAVGDNDNLTNGLALTRELFENGAICKSFLTTEGGPLFTMLIASETDRGF